RCILDRRIQPSVPRRQLSPRFGKAFTSTCSRHDPKAASAIAGTLKGICRIHHPASGVDRRPSPWCGDSRLRTIDLSGEAIPLAVNGHDVLGVFGIVFEFLT